jgi:hypothetical protein
MPLEAIHLTALADSLEGMPELTARCGGDRLADARLGAMLFDLPYYDRFPIMVVRYILGRPLAVSQWGDIFHLRRPAGLAKHLLGSVRGLRARGAAADAERLLAFALGYVNHLAIDAHLHPLVNRQAKLRVARLGGSLGNQHSQVEKFHSVMFHEERLGFDFVGRHALRRHLRVDGHELHRLQVFREAVTQAAREVLGETLAPEAVARWARGFAQYAWFASSVWGRWLTSETFTAELRAEVYDGPWGSFRVEYATALELARAHMTAAMVFAEGGADEAFDAAVPEGPVDEPPPGWPAWTGPAVPRRAVAHDRS